MNKEQKQSKSFIEKIKTVYPPLTILGIILGAIGGYIYYVKVGCMSGTCPITSNPWMSVILGALLGYLVFAIFNRKPKQENKS